MPAGDEQSAFERRMAGPQMPKQHEPDGWSEQSRRKQQTAEAGRRLTDSHQRVGGHRPSTARTMKRSAG